MRRHQPILAFTVALVLVVLTAGAAAALEVGDKAPDFTLTGPGNKPVKLADLTATGKPIVLYTFIQAFTGT
jgi:AhpC/TSA family